MTDLKRREFLALAAAPLLMPQRGPAPAPVKLGSALMVCMHEASSERFDFRAAMEG